MRAARFEETGDLSYLQVVECPSRPLGDKDGEVRVRVAASGINPSDVKNVLGKMHHTTVPRTPGREFAGTVVEGPAELVGQEVWGVGGDVGFTVDGTHAEEVVLPRAAVCVRPPELPLLDAATLGVALVTASIALTEGRCASGQTVAVIGARGNVGRVVVQLASLRGAHVLTGVRAPDPLDDLEFDAEQLPDSLLALTNGRGVDLLVDAAGLSHPDRALHALAERGRMVVMATADPEITINLFHLYRRHAQLIGVNSLLYDTVACARILSALTPALVGGALTAPFTGQTVGLDDLVDGYRRTLQPGVHGARSGKIALLLT